MQGYTYYQNYKYKSQAYEEEENWIFIHLLEQFQVREEKTTARSSRKRGRAEAKFWQKYDDILYHATPALQHMRHMHL
jgi:hypothetical protein